MSKPVVGWVMPRGNSTVRCDGAAEAFYRTASQRGVELIQARQATSLAIRCFNMLFCDILNARRQWPQISHFAMIHDDICPDPGCVDTLLDVQGETGADLVSAVVPIKNGRGVTSTAVDMTDPWVVRRLTMHEIFDLPATFGLEDIPWRLATSQLLVNTGLWLLRIDAEWFRRLFPLNNGTGQVREAPLYFQDHARILQLANGEYVSEDISEDWDWSRQINALGLRVVATRRVGLYHEREEFHTRSPWGAWKTDLGYEVTMRRLQGLPAVI